MKPGDRVRLRAELPTIEPWPEGCVPRAIVAGFVRSDLYCMDGPITWAVLSADDLVATVVVDPAAGRAEFGPNGRAELSTYRLPLACLEVVPEPVPDLYLLEVGKDWRSGRGRWWRPGGQGYTDRLESAGLYTLDDHRVRDAAFTEGRCIVRPLADVLAEASGPAAALLQRAREVFDLRVVVDTADGWEVCDG